MAARKKKTDPATELAELEASLGAGLAPGYVLRGKEEWFRRRGVDLLRAAAERDGLEVRMHAGDDPDFALGAVLSDLSGAGLFAAQHFVVARGVDAELKKVANKDSALTRAVRAFVERGDAGTVVVVSDGLRADHAVAKAAVAAGGRVVDCRKLWESPPPWRPDPRQSELVQWTLGVARAQGVALTPDQAVALTHAKGNDLFALEAELGRIAATGDRSVIGALEATAAGSPWAVADDVVAGRLGDALVGCERLFSGGFVSSGGKRETGEGALVGIVVPALTRAAHQMAAAAEALDAGAADGEALAFAGAPAQRERAAAVVRSRTPAEWAALLGDAVDLETRSKTGGLVGRDDLTRFALRWRARGGSRRR